MKLTVGKMSPQVIALLVLMLVGAGGYLWWQFSYKPAVENRDQALMANNTAQQELQAAQQRLTQAQEQAEAVKKANGEGLDDSVAKLQLSQQAITPQPFVDDAAMVVMTTAKRAGIRSQFKFSEPDKNANSASTGEDAIPLDMEISAVGTYAQALSFVDMIEDTVEVKSGKAHIRGRLFNIVALRFGVPNDELTEGAEETLAARLRPRKGEIDMQFTLRMYTSKLSDSSANLSSSTPSTDAGATDAGAGMGAGTDATTDPNAAATAGMTQPDAANAMPQDAATATGSAPMADAGTTPPVATDPAAAGAGNATSTPGVSG